MSLDVYRDKLSGLISTKRFNHVNRVSEVAGKLALQHGLDEYKAQLAGLMHDAAKELSPDKLKGFGVAEEDLEIETHLNFPKVWHAFVAPAFCKHHFSITDEETLSAMKWHTTGKEAMAPLEQLVFVADYIEPGRDLPDRAYIEELAFSSLDDACFALSYTTLLSLLKRGLNIHPLSVSCHNHYLSCSNSSEKIKDTLDRLN
jgi:predicted HD superfamily hydrolase involved in NAD metabolism